MYLKIISFYFITIATREFHSNIVNGEDLSLNNNAKLINDEMNKPDAGVRRTAIDEECPAGRARNKGRCIDPGFNNRISKRQSVLIDAEVDSNLIDDICDKGPDSFKVISTSSPPHRKWKPENYLYMLPRALTMGDSISIVFTLKRPAFRFQIFLINRGNGVISFGNMPLDFTFDIGAGEKADNVSLSYHKGYIKTTVAEEKNKRQLIFVERLFVILKIRPHLKSEKQFETDVYLNDILYSSVEWDGSLEDVGYLQILGDIKKVHSLDFKMIKP